MSLIFLFVFCFVGNSVIDCSMSCRDQNNKPVDWFMVYKLPEVEESSDPGIQSGLAYYYLDVNSQYWTEGKVLLNETGQAIAYTLQQVYNNHKSQDVLYLLYNDETPEKNVSYSHGHTKGGVCFDKTSGFWLVHSVPRFPPYANETYAYPNSGRRYGQTFLCVTYDTSTLDAIGQQFLYNYPQIYDYNVPNIFHKENPNIVLAVSGKSVDKAPWQSSVTLTSKAGTKFTSFAKYKKFAADLYHDWLAVYYKSDMFVESWLNGQGSLTSNCSGPYKAYNIKQLQISKLLFNESHDHSKWAVTSKPSQICIGDINRQHAQLYRAGGTVCINNHKVWSLFNQSITVYQTCQTHKLRQFQVHLNDLDHPPIKL